MCSTAAESSSVIFGTTTVEVMATRLHRVYNSQAAAGMAIAQMRRTTTAVSEANDGAEGGGGGGGMTLHTIVSPLEVSVQCGALLGRGHQKLE